MKRKFTPIIVMIAILMSFLVSCSSNDNSSVSEENVDLSGYPWELVKSELSIYEKDDILLEIDEDTISNVGLTYKVSNNSKRKISFGSEYSIQIEVKDAWYTMTLTPGWTAELFELESSKQSELDVSWELWAGELPVGEYRLVKPVEGVLGKDIYLACEFEIEQHAVMSIYEGDEWSIRIDDNTVSPKEVTYYICNNTDEVRGCGRDFYLQVKVDEKWYKIVPPVIVDIPTDETILEIGKEVEETAYFEHIYGKLPKGEYRIVKPVGPTNLACEFEIK